MLTTTLSRRAHPTAGSANGKWSKVVTFFALLRANEAWEQNGTYISWESLNQSTNAYIMYANNCNVTHAIELRKWLLIMHLNGNVEADRQLTSQLTSRFGEFAGWLYLLYTALPRPLLSLPESLQLIFRSWRVRSSTSSPHVVVAVSRATWSILAWLLHSRL